MRLIFYPAVIAWFLIGIWIVSLRVKVKSLEEKIQEIENEKTY
jgi:heme exporter protein C